MNRRIEATIKKSSEDFLGLVWPAIGARLGRPIPVESVADSAFAKELDTRAGIDAWLIDIDGHIRGLASRVQWNHRSYDTFTVRVKSSFGGPTEFDKRKHEIATPGTITPHYFVQGYVTLDRRCLLAAAIARMRDVIAAVELDKGWLMPRNEWDGTQGYAIRWSILRALGAPIRVWPEPEPSLFPDGAT
jgi:hypothetical protein